MIKPIKQNVLQHSQRNAEILKMKKGKEMRGRNKC